MTQDVRPSNCCAIAHAVSPKIFEEPWPIWIIDSHRRFHKGVTVGNCRMNRLLFPDEMVLHALTFATGSSSRNLEGTKISSKKVEEFCLLRRPRQCFLQVSVKALQQVGHSSTLGWFSRVTNVGTKGLIHWLVKQTQFCMSLLLRGDKTGAFKESKASVFKLVFIPILTCGPES